jgi:transcriptional regulator with XRE-family HTH domain
MNDLTSALRKYKEEHNYTLHQMEEKFGVGKSSLHQILNGETETPRLTTLKKIAETLELPLWKVIRMAGFNLGFEEMELLRLEAEQNPDLKLLLELLGEISEEDRDAILEYALFLQSRKK